MPVNPNVYQPHDGHPYQQSPWPSMQGKCELCGQPQHQHRNPTDFYKVKRINVGDGDHFYVLNPDGTAHEVYDTRIEAEEQAENLNKGLL
jgi:hypothetical protein